MMYTNPANSGKLCVAAVGLAALASMTLSDRLQAASVWTPNDITTYAWYDASQTGSISDSSGTVSQWNDLSGNDQHLNTVGGNPQTGTRTLNTLNMIDFDGSDYLENTSFSVPTSGNITIFQVTEIDSNSNSDYRTAFLSMDANKDFQLGHSALLTSGIGAAGQTNHTSLNGSGPSIFSLTFNLGSGIAFHADGTQVSSTTYTTALEGLKFRTMSNRGTNFLTNGAVGEIIMVEDVTESTRVLIEGYLAHKWGLEDNLATDHLYKNTAPTVVPEPSAAILFGLGLLLLFRRRRHDS